MTKRSKKTSKRGKNLGRPRNDGRPPITRVEILKASAKLFASGGYSGTSMRDISQELGATPSSVFNHFPKKEAILEEVFRAGLIPSLKFYRQLEASGAPAAVQLYHIVTNDISAIANFDRSFKGIVSLPEARDPKFPAIFSLRKKTVNHFRKLISSAVEEGDFREVNAAVISEAITILGELPAFAVSKSIPTDELSNEVAEFVFLGLLANPRRLTAIRKANDALADIVAQFEF